VIVVIWESTLCINQGEEAFQGKNSDYANFVTQSLLFYTRTSAEYG
jgi:hypothetical protein